MNTHVFVVDSTTFKIHLERMFAGTGAKDKKSPFLTQSDATFNANTERNLVGMIADISRVRPGDNVIFYLQATSKNPGMFFGVFKAASTAYFDENDTSNYLINELGKGLSFRIKIENQAVYAKGISEHQYLDSLSGKSKPYQLCWSLIYRKLKGNRGCTMITPYEFDDLLEKLKQENQSKALSSYKFTFDESTCEIVAQSGKPIYQGRQKSISITPRLLYKANRNNAFETHLQAYITQNFDKKPLSDLLLPEKSSSFWIGNEVSCGVGMQRIDILIMQECKDSIHLRIVELKDEEPYDYILDEQLPWYVEWASYYMVPNYEGRNKEIYVHPCIVARKTTNSDIVNRIKGESIRCTASTSAHICDTEYIAFNVSDGISFRKI